jgi:putative ABC transport system ATP-binding protein
MAVSQSVANSTSKSREIIFPAQAVLRAQRFAGSPHPTLQSLELAIRSILVSQTMPVSASPINEVALQGTIQPAIQIDHVSRHYAMGESSIRAVDDVSLTIPTGEFLALLGSSGSGKSTLLNLMAGLDRPTSGAILSGGRNLEELSPLELARYRRNTVGMVFQSFNLLPRMTLEENVELPLRLAEVERSERAGRVREALERVRLAKRTGHRPSELSGGEQQRTAIARALVNRPKILFADEPTGNLDSATGEAILTLLREIQSSMGMTIIMVTHERHLAEKFADRLAIMGDGKLLSTNASASHVSTRVTTVTGQ